VRINSVNVTNMVKWVVHKIQLSPFITTVRSLLTASFLPRVLIRNETDIAAQQNHREACFALTAWYLVGSPGVLPQSDTEAYLWARKSAEMGLAKAEYAVGYFTEVRSLPFSFLIVSELHGSLSPSKKRTIINNHI
jgi:TPR repeat protein